MHAALRPLASLDLARLETAPVLKVVARASRVLGELNGIAAAIPNDAVLINALALQEAKDSSQIENIVTTHDELFKANASITEATASAKEVTRYAQALRLGYKNIRDRGILSTSAITDIQAELEPSRAGFRKVLGTTLRDSAGNVVYTPPNPQFIADLMSDLERFIRGKIHPELDPLVRMAIAHHQFESIHPFYDGNGRTGRILNVLMLVREGLLDTPILYMSRAIVRTKSDYYRLLQAVRATDDAPEIWEEWLVYMAAAVYSAALHEKITVVAIATALQRMKQSMRTALPKIYSHDLINNLFTHPYTKISLVERDLSVTRITATKYLNALAENGFLARVKAGRSYYYVNQALLRVLQREDDTMLPDDT